MKGPQMNFYLASGLKNVVPAGQLIKELVEKYSWFCTYDWTLHGSLSLLHEPLSREWLDQAAKISAYEIGGVKEAQLVVAWMPGGRGTHCEIGGALALNKPILLLYGTDEDLVSGHHSVFHYHPLVRRLDLRTIHHTPLAEAVSNLGNSIV